MSNMPDEPRTRQPRTWRPEPGQGPLIIAHRGASAQATENTLAAFERAMRDGADGVELDVQCCATGEVVVFHDDDLRRLADTPTRIDQMSLAALRQVRLRPGGEIPTLAEAIDVCGPTGLVNIEIKIEGILPTARLAGVVARVGEVVARAAAESRVLISSFSPGVLWVWRRRYPEIPCGLLFEKPRPFHRPWPLRADILLPWLSPNAVHPPDELCAPARIRAWRRRGYEVNVWTVDDLHRIEALAALGVGAIITNDPARARLRLTARA